MSDFDKKLFAEIVSAVIMSHPIWNAAEVTAYAMNVLREMKDSRV